MKKWEEKSNEELEKLIELLRLQHPEVTDEKDMPKDKPTSQKVQKPRRG